jgi:hypothetical protein
MNLKLKKIQYIKFIFRFLDLWIFESHFLIKKKYDNLEN